MAVILDDLAALGHGLQRGRRFVELGRIGLVEEGEGGVTQPLDPPAGFAARQAQAGAKGVGFGQARQGSGPDLGAPPDIVDRTVRVFGPGQDHAGRVGFGQLADHPQAQPHRKAAVTRLLQGAVPA